MVVKRKPHGKRRVGRPRKRRAPRQAGGQLGAIMPVLKFLGPLILGEVAKLGISSGLKRIRGKGVHGRGLKLSGAGHVRRLPQRRRVAGVRKARRRGPMHTLPFSNAQILKMIR